MSDPRSRGSSTGCHRKNQQKVKCAGVYGGRQCSWVETQEHCSNRPVLGSLPVDDEIPTTLKETVSEDINVDFAGGEEGFREMRNVNEIPKTTWTFMMLELSDWKTEKRGRIGLRSTWCTPPTKDH